MSELIRVTADTLEHHGFFCKMSARKTKAWADKRDWLLARFDEGLQLRLLGGGQRGFIEFIPGAYAWRAIEGAEDLVVIHCLWVVGKSKGQGHARALLDSAEDWARDNGYRGVAALTSSGNWLIRKGILELRGYESVEAAAPGFDLMLKRFAPGKAPRLSGGWEKKAAEMGPGLAVLRSAQCPYLEDAAAHARDAAEELGLKFSDRVITSAEELRRLSPTPYGVFALTHEGRLLASHYLLKKDILKAVAKS
ncbi:GNAT family N-acetyltransferase [Rhodobacteraceae bacterium LMO-12]|nr:GNAT family N-acetyltransferase [Rhodobacteraceae bacterium LMO-JJ12]